MLGDRSRTKIGYSIVVERQLHRDDSIAVTEVFLTLGDHDACALHLRQMLGDPLLGEVVEG